MARQLEDAISDIICYGHGCGSCYLYKYQKDHHLKWCSEVPIPVQLKYVLDLIADGNKNISSSIRSYSRDPDYQEAISLIKSGGVKYSE